MKVHLITEDVALAGLVDRVVRLVLHDAADAAVIAMDTDRGRFDPAPVRDAAARSPDFEVVIASPHPEAEAWYVAALSSLSDAEQARHREVCDELKFDPCHQPHRLTSTQSSAPTDAKRVLRQILEGSRASSSVGQDEVAGLLERCYADATCLFEVAKRGEDCGFNAFIAEVRVKLGAALGLPPL